MKNKSIYERIEQVLLEDGRVPENFELEQETIADSGISFASGALEGILGHHVARNDESDESGAKLAQFLKKHLHETQDSVTARFEQEWSGQKIIYMRTGLLREIIGHKDEYDAGRLIELAYYMMTQTYEIETVKLGLTLMTVFDISCNEQITNILITLGCCEEFTEYVLMNISGWTQKEQNTVCFQLAQKLSGWGKIHAVERLEADTEEIQEWILCEGCKNSIMYAYLGLECAEKSNLLQRLKKGGLSERELQGAGDIMDGLLDEGPCAGISALENAGETIYFYLCESSVKKEDVHYLSQLLIIREYLEKKECDAVAEDDWKEKALEKLNDILSSVDIKKILTGSLEQSPHDAVRAAQLLNVDISEKLLEQMKLNFDKYYLYGHYFFRQNRLIEDYIALCEKNIHYDKIPAGMGMESGFGKQEHWPVDMVVQYLNRYCGQGMELIRVSIHSPIIRWRNMAAKALEGWMEQSGKTLQDIAAPLYADVCDVAEIECDAKLKKRWEKILEGGQA